jgi:hypothetical protein
MSCADYDLTRTFTPDMKKADSAVHLSKVALLGDVMKGTAKVDLSATKNILWMTWTLMQNVAVLDMMRDS